MRECRGCLENHIEMYVRDGIIRQNILWAVDTLP